MTSGTGNDPGKHGPNRAGGFTLLEISLVILIIVIAAGALVPLIGAGLEEQELRRLSGEMEQLVRTARSDAIRTGVVTRIYLSPKSVAYVAGKVTEEPDATISIPKGTSLQIMRWGEERLRAPDADVWLFQPTGLTEPVKVRFAHGESSISMAFASLTGEPEEINFYFP